MSELLSPRRTGRADYPHPALLKTLVGLPNSGSTDINAAPALEATYHAVYFHDDFQRA
jgi:hypothetical protein